jgi:hypothetical protein
MRCFWRKFVQSWPQSKGIAKFNHNLMPLVTENAIDITLCKWNVLNDPGHSSGPKTTEIDIGVPCSKWP